jgi:hypothetical protein
MKRIKASIELEVPNSIAKRAARVGFVIYKDGNKYCAKIDQYDVDPRKSTIDVDIAAKNGKKG